MLVYAGFQTVYDLEDGFAAWNGPWEP